MRVLFETSLLLARPGRGEHQELEATVDSLDEAVKKHRETVGAA